MEPCCGLWGSNTLLCRFLVEGAADGAGPSPLSSSWTGVACSLAELLVLRTVEGVACEREKTVVTPAKNKYLPFLCPCCYKRYKTGHHLFILSAGSRGSESTFTTLKLASYSQLYVFFTISSGPVVYGQDLVLGGLSVTNAVECSFYLWNT